MLLLLPPYTPSIIDEESLVDPISETIDLGSLPVRLSVNVAVTASAANKTFIDGVLASGTITITDYLLMTEETATASDPITFGTPDPGDTIIVDNGTIHTFTCVAAAPGADEFSDITELTALIDALDGLSATDDATDITITVDTPGTVPNSWSITGTGTFAALDIEFTGGQDAATVTVAGHTLVEGDDFTAETSNNVTADNLAAAIDALDEVQAANPAAAIITVKAATVGTAGNAIDTSQTGLGVTVEQATLENGEDSAVDGVEFTISIPSHGYSTGVKVNYDVLGGTTLDNLVNNTDYWVIKVDDDTIALALTEEDAIDDVRIEIADADDAVGGGSFQLTPTTIDVDIVVSASNDATEWVELESDSLSATGALLYEYPTVSFRYLKVEVDPNDSEAGVEVTLHTKL